MNELKWKSNKKLFNFNKEVKDRMDAASLHIAKLPKETQDILGFESCCRQD